MPVLVLLHLQPCHAFFILGVMRRRGELQLVVLPFEQVLRVKLFVLHDPFLHSCRNTRLYLLAHLTIVLFQLLQRLVHQRLQQFFLLLF